MLAIKNDPINVSGYFSTPETLQTREISKFIPELIREKEGVTLRMRTIHSIPFIIHKTIGKGADGEVYRASIQDDHENYAMKKYNSWGDA